VSNWIIQVIWRRQFFVGEEMTDKIEMDKAKNILKKTEVKNILCFFSDLRGILQSFTVPASEFIDGEAYRTGLGFDGSSISARYN